MGCICGGQSVQGLGRFCSESCRRWASAHPGVERRPMPGPCERCGQPLKRLGVRAHQACLSPKPRPVTYQCQWCGASIEGTSQYPRKYCKDACKLRAVRQRLRKDPEWVARVQAKEAARVRAARSCPVCETSYHPTCGDQRTCSRACANILVGPARSAAARRNGELRRRKWPRSRIYAGTCQWPPCGRAFVTRHKRMACTPDHSRRLGWQRDNAKRRPPARLHPCESCPALVRSIAKRCEVCARRMRRINSRHRTRARKYGVAYTPINVSAVFERDRWRCQLCRKPLARTRSAPHPRSPSIDCIVPLSVPGSPGYTLANVQAAHFQCNSLKGARGGGEQLRLV